jgi:prepilin-type N-terminal cleavage/methylation domain-containing protein
MQSLNHRMCRGFTLIELMAGMAILSVLVLLLARFFDVSTTAYDLGTRQASNNNNGRAVLDFIAKELSTAAADEHLTFRLERNVAQTYNVDDDENSERIYFVSLGNEPGPNERSGIQVVYYLALMKDTEDFDIPSRYRLMRSVRSDIRTASYEAYQWNGNSGIDWTDDGYPLTGSSVIAENVSAFQIWAYPTATSLAQQGDYRSPKFGNRLPAWVDIYLEVLDEADAVKVATVHDNSRAEGEVLSRRLGAGYLTRVYFSNRDGYGRN